jgi:hypothetical protein
MKLLKNVIAMYNCKSNSSKWELKVTNYPLTRLFLEKCINQCSGGITIWDASLGFLLDF